MAPKRSLALLLSCLGILSACDVRAQPASGAQSTFIDPSIASSGMGKAGAVAFWRDDPNDWENPALLGSSRGVRYVYGRTQLIPDLADDVYFTSKRLILGGAGIGVSVAGKPFDSFGTMRMDYGESIATDIDGNVIGTYHSYEEIRQLGIGLNVVEAVEHALRFLGTKAPDLSRHVDLSVGHAWKTVVGNATQAGLNVNPFVGEVTERDRGALLRVTPLDRIRDPDASAHGARLRLDAAVGFSQRNYADEEPTGSSLPVFEERLVGLAARATIEFPGEHRKGIWDFIAPTVALGVSGEEARYYDGGTRVGDYEATRRTGQELAVADLLFLRHGYIDDPVGTVQGDTWGIGAQVRYREAAGIRYDFARIPQSKFLDSVKRHGFTVFVDPVRIVEELR